MNFEQFGTGKLNIGYFFLLAVLTSALLLALSTSLTPLEAAWYRARQRYAVRKYSSDDKDLIQRITKRQIFWAFVRRHFPPAEIIYDSWENAKYALSEASSTFIDPKDIPFFSILRYIYSKQSRKLMQKLKNLRASTVKKSSADGPARVEPET